jgi:pimeloyl-ACP methyl ester carboxylesterase
MSRDGTPIAYDRQGAGPPVILVGGGLDDGSENAPLATDLADRFTVYNYARRGRGESGDTKPYAVKRELEDIEALISQAGGSAHVYGVSSGACSRWRPQQQGWRPTARCVRRAYDMAAEASQRNQEYRKQLQAVLAQGRRGDAVELFMRLAGSSDESIADARSSPYWPGLEALAPTLAYAEFFELAADAIIAAIPIPERVVLEGQGHVADPKAVATVLERFLNE